MVNSKGGPGVHSSLFPSILRQSGQKDRVIELNKRFSRLAAAEEKLKESFAIREIHQDRIVRWAILQHYEIVPTPLLDVTLSVQSALSFALAEGRDEGYLFILAFPQLTGPISVSIESMTQVIDLTQVCPPEALRPHFQSGVLVCDYPVVDSRESSHGKKGMLGNNFSCRLLGKLKLTNCRMWVDEGFVSTRSDILFPDSYDEWFPMLSKIKQYIQAI